MPSLEKLIEGGEGVALESGTAFTCTDAGCSVPSLTVSLSIRV